jgi:hypothetical protein
LYTGAREIELKANVPNATQMLISTDAGFAGASWQPYQDTFGWTLPDTGGRIATLLVYVRFGDATNTLLCGSQTADDVIYDPVAPSVTAALTDAAAATRAAATVATTDGAEGPSGSIAFELTLMANDQENGSGVERMQISMDESFSDATWQPYSPAVTVNATPGQLIYIRVQDGTGNISSAVSVSLPGTLPDAPTQSPTLFIPQVSR